MLWRCCHVPTAELVSTTAQSWTDSAGKPIQIGVLFIHELLLAGMWIPNANISTPCGALPSQLDNYFFVVVAAAIVVFDNAVSNVATVTMKTR